MEAVIPKLSPIYWQYVQSVKTEDDVNVLLGKTFSRQDMIQSLFLRLFSLKFVKDYYKGGLLCQEVHNTSNLPEAACFQVAGLSIAQIALLVYWEGRRGDPRLFCCSTAGKAIGWLEMILQVLHCC